MADSAWFFEKDGLFQGKGVLKKSHTPCLMVLIFY